MLDVQGLVTKFPTRDGIVAPVNDVSFKVGAGEVVGVVGESGCGKSMTVRSILGLVPRPGYVETGSALLDGCDLVTMNSKELRELRGSQIGFVAQNPFGTLNPVLKIKRQFFHVMQAHRAVSRAQAYDRAAELFRSVGIPDVSRVLDGYPHELSGGMAQRVGIAMALALHPKLVIADEPTTALDVTVQRQVLDAFAKHVVDEDRALLLVTHDLGIVAQYCQRVVVLYAGKVVETGPVKEVFSTPGHPYTEALLSAVPRRGEPLVNLRGRLPSLSDYPVGCPFAPRCPHAFERCAHDPPQLQLVGSGRLSSCHLHDGTLPT